MNVRAIAPRRRVTALLTAAILGLAEPAAAAPANDWAGRYRVAEGPDVAGGLELRADGRFAYVLIAGALDERAEGDWVADGEAVRLTTRPKPRPAEFTVAPAAADAMRGPLRLAVRWPDGRGIAGIDFRIGLAGDGEPLEGYTQEDGWTAPDGERQPAWVELAEPIHGTASPRFPVPPGQRALSFVLNPHDLGVADFAQAAFTRQDGSYSLFHPRGGRLRLVREER